MESEEGVGIFEMVRSVIVLNVETSRPSSYQVPPGRKLSSTG